MNQTDLVRRAFWRTLFATVGIWVFAILGMALVYDFYIDARKEILQAEGSTFRHTFVVAQDLQRFSNELEKIQAIDEPVTEDFDSALIRLDHLAVRSDALKAASERGDHPVAVLRDLIRSVQFLVSTADAILDAPPELATQQFPALLSLMEDVNGNLLKAVDEQYFAQVQAIAVQGETFERIMASTAGLFLVMCLVATGAVLLYRRSLLAQARRMRAEKKAHYLAYFDPMTGLPNRSRFRVVADELFKTKEDPLLIIFDLDGFKLINDTHGHAAGDKALVHAATVIQNVVKESGGTAARLGGDEFAAVVPGPISSMRAAAICEQILADCADPFDADGITLSIGLSIGIVFRRSVETEPEDIVSAAQKAADIALYRAKGNGKNTYAFFDADLAEMVERRRNIEIGIDEALRDDGFSLAFQPQIDLASGEVKGFEALCRWTRDGVPISPGEFISVAEATGQVMDIDIWGLRHALRTLADWIHDGRMPVSMSANLSPMHFRNDDIVNIVKTALKETGLPPSLVTLEITESILIDDMSKVIAILDRLRALGVRLALDDFGTGYSSLAYLRRLNVDYIKIDQSFMRDLEPGSENSVILNSLVSLAQGLGKKLVVEGIETEAQSNFVCDLGCDVGQGYLFGRPLPEEDARAMVPVLTEPSQQSA